LADSRGGGVNMRTGFRRGGMGAKLGTFWEKKILYLLGDINDVLSREEDEVRSDRGKGFWLQHFAVFADHKGERCDHLK